VNDILIYNQPDCVLPKSFFEGRNIPNVHPDSLDYQQWWAEQLDRCLNGWSDGGFSVTDVNYYHLNFKNINMLDAMNRPMFGHPYYSDEDQQFFNDVKECRRDGFGMALVTSRGWGKSYDGSSLAEHEFTFRPASETIISASIDKYAGLLWNKVVLGLNSQPDEIRMDLLVEKDAKGELMAGKKRKDRASGKEVREGTFSQLRRIVYDNDPGLTRGSRPNIHIFDEIGSWSGAAKLIQCYKMTEPSWWRGSVFTCFPLLMGTGGQMETGASEDAKKMFFDPSTYRLRAYEYKGKKIGKFFPGYSKLGGYYEKSGISDKVGAKAFLDDRRDSKKESPEILRQERMEFPFEPEEAFMVSSAGYLPVGILENRYLEISRNKIIQNVVKRGDLIPIKSGNQVIGARWIDDPNGPIMCAEPPFKVKGEVPHGLYISGCDSYDTVGEEEDKSGMKSKLSIKVYKRFYNISTPSHLFVCSYTLRTPDAREAYFKTLLINLWYDCQMLYEHTMKGIGMWYIMNKYHRYLLKRPQLDKMEIIKKFTSTNSYGMAMPDDVKLHCIKRYGEYIRENSDQMYFLPQVKDAIDFSFDSNEHDETMAAAIALVASDSIHHIEVSEVEENDVHWPVHTRDEFGNLQFA
jgi:hypothetical protein